MDIKYYLFTFEDSFDDGFGDNHGFINTIVLTSDSFLFPIYDKNHIYKQEITEKEYHEWDE